MANIDNLAPIQSKGKAAKGKSKKQAIEEAEAESETEITSEEDTAAEQSNIVEIADDAAFEEAPKPQEKKPDLADLMLDIKE